MSEFWCSNWEQKQVGELCDVIDPHPSHRAPREEPNGIFFLGIGDLKEDGEVIGDKARRVSPEIFDEHQDYYRITDNTIGFCRVASVGKVIEFRSDYPFKITISPTLAIIEPKDIDKKFLAYCLRSRGISDQVSSLSSGSTRESLGIKMLRELMVPVPPLPEQKKIAEILSGIDKVLTSLQLHADKLRLARDEVVATFFAEESKTDEFAEIRSFGEIVTGSTPPTNNPLNYGGVMPFISPGDIGDSAVVAETKSTLSAAGAAMSRVIPPSSVCVVCIGSTIGKVALTTTESATNQQINALTPGAYDPFFMLAAISHMKNEIRSAASTHAVPIINKSRFGEISIPKPSIERQRQFGNYISSSHKMLFHIMVEIQKYQYLKKAVSSDLLSGRKRVSV